MRRLVGRFVRAQSGATAIEYVMIAMLIALAIVSGVTLIGKSLGTDFAAVGNGFTPSSS